METFKGHINGKEFNTREEFEKALAALTDTQNIDISIAENKCACKENCKCLEEEQENDAKTVLDFLQEYIDKMQKIISGNYEKENTYKVTKNEIPKVETISNNLFNEEELEVNANKILNSSEYNEETVENSLDEISKILKERINYFSKETGKLYGFYVVNKISESQYESMLNELSRNIQEKSNYFNTRISSVLDTIKQIETTKAELFSYDKMFDLLGIDKPEDYQTKRENVIKEYDDLLKKQEFLKAYFLLLEDFTSLLSEIVVNSTLI